MSVATTLSRVTGFVRMWAIAFALGATGLMASYTVANNIPNMLYELVAGGIISALFIPTLMEVRARRGAADGDRFESHVFNLTVLALGVIALVGTFFPEPFIWTQTFRSSGAEAEVVRTAGAFFFRFFAIQVVIYGAGSIIQSRLNAERRYLWPALGPVFNNVVVIVTMFISAWLWRTGAQQAALITLAVGTTLGVVAMFGVQVPTLMRVGIRHEWSLGLRDPDLRLMLRLAVPTVIYVVTNLVAVSFRNASAFAVAPNGPAILTYAWTFYQLPYGILAVALATAVFTELSEASGTQDWPAFKFEFDRGLRSTAILILPTAAMLIALATPLVSLYRVGAFRPQDVAPVAGALRWWGVALVFYASTMFVLRSFYSMKDTRTPAYANLALTVVQVGLYYLLTTGVGAWPGIGLNGVPIADGIFFALLFVTLLTLLRRRIGQLGLGGVAGTYARMLLASLLGGSVAWGIAQLLAGVGRGGVATALLQVAVGGVAGLAVAWGLARLMGVREVDIVARVVRRMTGRGRGGEGQ